MDWDGGDRVFAVPQGLNVGMGNEEDELTPARVSDYTREFIRNFRIGTLHVYRDRLVNSAQEGRFHLEIDLEHLKNFSEELHDALTRFPGNYLESMETGARDYLIRSKSLRVKPESIPLVQITFIGQLRLTPIREITAAEVHRLLLVPGIVISAAHMRPRAIKVSLRCRKCNKEIYEDVPPGGAIKRPSRCSGMVAGNDGGGGAGVGVGDDKNCGPDPYEIDPEKCTYVDEQKLKLQEAPEQVPTGEMPRTMEVIVDRVFAGRISPGTRLRILAIASIQKAGEMGGGRGGGRGGGAKGLRVPYLRAVGVIGDEEGGGRNAITTFTPEEEARVKTLASDPDIFNRLAMSMAPSIYGDYADDIKKAIVCMLLGGRWKRLPDGGRLRGDVNMLLLGDPSTAKSQFLKFVEKVSPVSVYTSGKGSSAAGLTASVIKDARGEFHLEGGAMVLADGGVVCIDEFDKMREEDRVAIHEAMEQQTISVAKAGITTILNSRCSVFAAANPVYGRYDDSKSIADNIDLLPTILSRFDLIFIVRDTRDGDRDRELARRVIQNHVLGQDVVGVGGRDEGDRAHGTGGGGGGGKPGELDLADLTKFIAYARAKCAPVLTAEAAEMLAGEYADIRQTAEGAARDRQAAAAGKEGTNVGSVVPITVRQLEALVRVTEAVAKASLSREATVEHVKEALHLFKKSTLAAAQKGNGLGDVLSADMTKSVRACEVRILKVVGPGQTLPVAYVKSQLRGLGFDEGVINTALRVMDSRDEVKLVDERKMVRRHK